MTAWSLTAAAAPVRMPRAMRRHLHKTSWECGCLDTQPLLTGNLTGAGCKGRQRRGQTVWGLGGILASPQP